MNQVQPAKTAAAAPIAKEQASSFLTDGYRQALDRLNQAFTERLPLAILIGEDRAGSSDIINSFLDGIEDDVAVAHITEPCTDAITCLCEILHALGFDSDGMGVADLAEVLSMFLSLQKMHDRRMIICIDGAQDYGRSVLDEVYRLVELEKGDEFGLLMILTGRSGLNELLRNTPFSGIPDNTALRIALAPFTLAEATDYIGWRVEQVRHANVRPVFEADAITLIHDLTEGLPDAVRNLCSNCLLLAEKEGITQVSARIVISARQKLGLTHAMLSSGARGVAGARGRLIVQMDGQVVQEQELKQGQVLIGRDRRCEVYLANSAVSRRHAKIVVAANGATISDLGSRNSTYVNGRPIEHCQLQDGDSIQIGQCVLDYVQDNDGGLS